MIPMQTTGGLFPEPEFRYYTLTKPARLNHNGKMYTFKPGTVVGVDSWVTPMGDLRCEVKTNDWREDWEFFGPAAYVRKMISSSVPIKSTQKKAEPKTKQVSLPKTGSVRIAPLLDSFFKEYPTPKSALPFVLSLGEAVYNWWGLYPTSKKDFTTLLRFREFFQVTSVDVWLYRGTALRLPAGAVSGEKILIKTHRASDTFQSWSFDYTIAKEFADQAVMTARDKDKIVVLQTKLPTKYLVSVPGHADAIRTLAGAVRKRWPDEAGTKIASLLEPTIAVINLHREEEEAVVNIAAFPSGLTCTPVLIVNG